MGCRLAGEPEGVEGGVAELEGERDRLARESTDIGHPVPRHDMADGIAAEGVAVGKLVARDGPALAVGEPDPELAEGGLPGPLVPEGQPGCPGVDEEPLAEKAQGDAGEQARGLVAVDRGEAVPAQGGKADGVAQALARDDLFP